jgi:hypothetical protein
MFDAGKFERIPDLQGIAVQATRALALLDAAKLEELALTCETLHRQGYGEGHAARSGASEPAREAWRREMKRQQREAKAAMAVFRQVLDATRASLQVMRTLRSMRMGELEYRAPRAWAVNPANPAESGHGNN